MKDRSVEERTPRARLNARLNANRGEAGQLARLKSAALLVRVGLDHEPWLRRALARLGDGAPAPGGPRDLDLSRSITLLQAETPRLRADAAPGQRGGELGPALGKVERASIFLDVGRCRLAEARAMLAQRPLEVRSGRSARAAVR